MNVSFITLTKDKCQLVSELAGSMENVHPKDVQVEWIVVDNGTDGTEASLRNICKKTELVYIKHDNSGNFSAQNNWAAKKARGDYVVFLNNDTRFLTPWLWAIMYLETVPEIGCVGAVLMYPDFKLQHCGVGLQEDATPFNVGTMAFDKLGLRDDLDPRKWKGNAKGFAAVTGAFLVMRKGDFEKLRGFDETFNWAFEDVDLCLRAKAELGLHTVCSRDIALLHYESQSGGDRAIQANLDAFRGRWMGRVKNDMDEMCPQKALTI